MNTKLLLVTAISLLYRESQLPAAGENSSELVRKIIEEIRLPEHSLTLDSERGTLHNLVSTIHYMCNQALDYQYDESELLQRLRVDTNNDSDLYQSFVDGIKETLDVNSIKKRCINLRRTLKNYFKDKKVEEIIGKAGYELKFKRENIKDIGQFIDNVSAQLEPYRIRDDKKDPAIISDVNFDDPSSIAAVYDGIKNKETAGTYLQCGWQGINRMTGGVGFRRGDLVVVNALEHHYKTGFSLILFIMFALFNKPVLKDPTKKPLLLRISFEDQTSDNMQFIYKWLYEDAERKPADLSLVSEEEMTAYVIGKMTQNGWHVNIKHVNPYDWAYTDLCNHVVELESEGYEVHVCAVDYLQKMPTKGCDGTAGGEPLRNMFERVKAFMQARNILFMTPHQLSSDARMLIREGRLDFVKELPTKGYYSGSKQLGQIFDLEFFIHIEKVNGKFYLTVQRGKHRKVEQTPLENLYCVLPFTPIGPILSDVGRTDISLKRAGAGAMGSGEEIPFWMNV